MKKWLRDQKKAVRQKQVQRQLRPRRRARILSVLLPKKAIPARESHDRDLNKAGKRIQLPPKEFAREKFGKAQGTWPIRLPLDRPPSLKEAAQYVARFAVMDPMRGIMRPDMSHAQRTMRFAEDFFAAASGINQSKIAHALASVVKVFPEHGPKSCAIIATAAKKDKIKPTTWRKIDALIRNLNQNNQQAPVDKQVNLVPWLAKLWPKADANGQNVLAARLEDAAVLELHAKDAIKMAHVHFAAADGNTRQRLIGAVRRARTVAPGEALNFVERNWKPADRTHQSALASLLVDIEPTDREKHARMLQKAIRAGIGNKYLLGKKLEYIGAHPTN